MIKLAGNVKELHDYEEDRHHLFTYGHIVVNGKDEDGGVISAPGICLDSYAQSSTLETRPRSDSGEPDIEQKKQKTSPCLSAETPQVKEAPQEEKHDAQEPDDPMLRRTGPIFYTEGEGRLIPEEIPDVWKLLEEEYKAASTAWRTTRISWIKEDKQVDKEYTIHTSRRKLLQRYMVFEWLLISAAFIKAQDNVDMLLYSLFLEIGGRGTDESAKRYSPCLVGPKCTSWVYINGFSTSDAPVCRHVQYLLREAIATDRFFSPEDYATVQLLLTPRELTCQMREDIETQTPYACPLKA